MTDSAVRGIQTASTSPFPLSLGIHSTRHVPPAATLSSPSTSRVVASSSSSVASSSRAQPLVTSEADLESDQYFVRARFDFTATDPSALSFSAGDIIEVITMLDSGWWDGVLHGTRGWFPSNFVEEITEEDMLRMMDEAELVRAEEERIEDREDEEAVLSMEDVLGGDLGWEGSAGLEALAREMMEDELEMEMDLRRNESAHPQLTPVNDGHEFQEEARRRRLVMGLSAESISMAPEDDFGGKRIGREREDTDRTIRKTGTPLANTGDRDTRPQTVVDPSDAWIPSLTPDGQVYYHNTQTGENSWDLPINTPSAEDDLYAADDYFASLRERPNSRLPPPNKPVKAPSPWSTTLSDDAQGLRHGNNHTGRMQHEIPSSSSPVANLQDEVQRLSVSSAGAREAHRSSVQIRLKPTTELNRNVRDALQHALRPQEPPTMGLLMDNVNDALREIFEAAVAGSAAEEEMSRATDLGSTSGMATAVLREETAVEMLSSAHKATLAAIRELLTAFGYVGPLERSEDMPRPAWTGDMTLIGSIGLLSANVHAATTSKRVPNTSASVWPEVMRAASKLRDTLPALPRAVAPDAPPTTIDNVLGRPLIAWLSADRLGEMMGGRWGFTLSNSPLRVLDVAALQEVQRFLTQYTETTRNASESNVLDILRLAMRIQETLLGIDIVSAVDLDGDTREARLAKEDDAMAYVELVNQARYALSSLDETTSAITPSMSAVLLSGASRSSLDQLSAVISSCVSELATLQIISAEQISANNQYLVRGQIGHRSPLYVPPSTSKPRPHSAISTQSRTSRRSDGSSLPQQSRGLEEEFLDQEEELERRDRAGQMSGSGSSASLAPQRAKGTGDVSATSSTTSLAYQQTESDSGSQKAKRSSFMKFMTRTRSGSDTDDGRGTARSRGNRKLAKIFGEDFNALPSVPPPGTSSSGHPAQIDQPWFLREDYEPSEIVFDDRGAVKAGTLKALVARLTPHGSTDTSFFQAFLLTFRSFTTGNELFELLVERYNIAPPPTLSPTELETWKKMKQTPIRLRVSNTIRSWLDVHYLEAEDAPILDRIEHFAGVTLVANGSELLSKQLLTLVQRKRQGGGEGPRRVASGGMLSAPAPLVPRVLPGRDLRLTDVNPLELARQLTILEFDHFQRIKPIECLNKAWTMSDGEERAPNVRAVIHTANVLSGWVSVMCLSSKDVKQRATIMKYFIQTGIELRNMNNFSSMAAIAAGLNAAPISRLKRTKELLSHKTLSLKADLDRTLDSTKNFQNYKEMLKTINPPCVPFFGFWLSAFTFIADGNKDFVQPPGSATTVRGMTTSTSNSSLASNAGAGPSSAVVVGQTQTQTSQSAESTTQAKPLINFFKRSLSAEILRDIQQYQSQPYNLTRFKPVYDWLMVSMNRCAAEWDVDSVYELSLKIEPREKEEERITRMLHDSGFI
ncbi:hypothetical protein BCR39DRAFT_3332 [Naematelia encephala]|uniref:Ras guanine nucleotide exchange factor domain-containing protein n=1 Tax=Naematelia encephala TaxID=71784 RepID=A0A1Y2BKQ2_9TREE|nr:hypothetical protein BCR39DRAFT_3332 [Naematelia encephala]